ncbi:nitroreductase family protein [Streptacidiphilus sp. P02-A3a]|uniref:nitroreductase family protein n=1 Tax=Streptacidiphilus sp. P02-A3a TaxID=2704468 RepID=UPI0015FD11BB|nr:nitroreductase family protein [Streptacidiphilus sp. P02-A3a]QMU69454.1 oxidoreductase [Streptacidiphilus sp. P02-A3a]
MSRSAATSVPLHPLLAERWSPRSFDPEHQVDEQQLAAILEAARWAPSAGNRQPWGFLVGRRGDATHKAIFESLREANQTWAGKASLLVAAVADERGPDGGRNGYAAYDTGLAVAQLTLQAHALGLHAHQMAGFDHERLLAALDAPAEGLLPLTVTAIGSLAHADLLPEQLRLRETAARERRPLTGNAYAGSWGRPLDLG